MRMTDLIQKKKEGSALTEEEIRFIVQGFTDGAIPDYQMSAFLMAVCFQGMTEEETVWLTSAMEHSGDVLSLSGIPGTKVDKHSSGGVGDKTTLILAPIIAALGVPVAKMSGRGLGHTGGTIDKLESFPGFRTDVPEEQFLSQVNDIGICVAGQTRNLAPADKKIYALRDTTATVAQRSLIASSIMSKKLASGADAIVLDVKVGDGAFMKTTEEAEALARLMVRLGNDNGRRTAAILTAMEQPLGNAVGNILEVKEVLSSLRGEGPEDLMEVVFALGEQMLLFSDLSLSREEARRAMEEVIQSGKAFDKMAEWVKAQGGDPSFVKDPSLFPAASFTEEVRAEEEGYVTRIEAEKIGHAVMTLGGGRARKEDVIDLTVGAVLKKKTGDAVTPGDSLCILYANDREKLSGAVREIREAYHVGAGKPEPSPMVLMTISE